MAGTYSVTGGLTTLTTFEAAGGTLTEFTGWIGGAAPILDTDYFIQGNQCVSQQQAGAGKAPWLSSIAYQHSATFTLAASDVILVWHTFLASTAVKTFANKGLAIGIGTTITNFAEFYYGGSDVGRNPYGGWSCIAVDPTTSKAAAIYTAKGTWTPTGTNLQVVGGILDNLTAVSKGNQHAIDVIRYGRGRITATGGTATTVDYADALASTSANFPQMADYNDYNAAGTPTFGAAVDGGEHRFGLFQAQQGSFQWKGLMAIGNTSTSCYFDDANRSIFIEDCFHAYSGFNKIEIVNAATVVKWNAITFQALITEDVADTITSRLTPGDVEVVTAGARFEPTSCGFNDMGTFTLNANTTATSCGFRRCGLVSVSNTNLNSCSFEATTANAALSYASINDFAKLNACNFIGDNTSHAIRYTTSISSNTDITWNSTFDATTYANTSVASSATSTAGQSEVLLVNVAASRTLTINVSPGADSPTYRNTGPGTVIVQQVVVFRVTNIIDASEVRFVNTTTGDIYAGVESVGVSPTGLDGVTVDADPNNAGRFRVTRSYVYSSNIPTRIVVMNYGYIHYSQAVTLSNSDDSLLVSQTIDRNYANP